MTPAKDGGGAICGAWERDRVLESGSIGLSSLGALRGGLRVSNPLAWLIRVLLVFGCRLVFSIQRLQRVSGCQGTPACASVWALSAPHQSSHCNLEVFP